MKTVGSVNKKWRLFRTWAGRHPTWCAWQVTYRCNFRCQFCHYWAMGASAEEEPSVSEYAEGAQKLAKLGTLLISLAGGEPLLRTDIPEIVAAVGRFHFPFVTTNGWLLTPALARDIMAAGCWGVSVSIDYADFGSHDRRRGMVGAAEQAWRAVEMLCEARVHSWQRVNVIAVLMDDNIDQIEPLLEMCARRRAYFMVQPYGRLKTGSAAWVHNDGPVAPRLLALRKRHRNFLSNPYYLGMFDAFLHGGVPGCRAGRVFFNIDQTGDVAVCVERRHQSVGNLFRDDVMLIERRLRTASVGNLCRQCWYNCRG
ncbi:hypothetical protein LCGC14_2879270, partial [marine sediment metagenome]